MKESLLAESPVRKEAFGNGIFGKTFYMIKTISIDMSIIFIGIQRNMVGLKM
jgi:hypothetical protein